MKIQTALNHQTRFIARLNDIIMCAKITKPTHSDLCAEIRKRIFETDEMHRCPGHVFEYVRGYRDAMLDNLRDHIVWKVWFRGQHVIGSESVPDGAWYEVEPDKGAFFWKDSDRVWIPSRADSSLSAE